MLGKLYPSSNSEAVSLPTVRRTVQHLLEFVADTQTETAAVNVVTESCSNAAITITGKSYTESGTEVNRELEREPEIILDTKTTASTYKTGVFCEPRPLCSSTNTHVPVPFTFFIPRNSCTERVNPVIRASSLNTIECGNTDFKANHVLTKLMLIRNLSTITKTGTDCTRLSSCKSYTCNCHYSNK